MSFSRPQTADVQATDVRRHEEPSVTTPKTAQPPDDATNNRLSPRIDAEFEVTAQGENNFYHGLSENLSDGGLFFETYASHRLGDQLEVRFTLPGSDTAIESTVEVRWLRAHNPLSDTPAGVGVRFLRLDPDARAQIERFIRKRNPLFHEGS